MLSWLSHFFLSLKPIFRWRSLSIIFILFVVSMLGSVISLNLSSRHFVEREAIDVAANLAQTMITVRDLYSDTIVSKVKNLPGVSVTHDYENIPHGIPLPATFLLNLGKSIEAETSDIHIRYFSRYPFPWRNATGGPRDPFEEKALTNLTLYPDQPFSRFENYQGRLSLRYTIADRMKPTCVACHNTHPDSPKKTGGWGMCGES